MSKPLFSLFPYQEEEPNATQVFTALSLSTGIPGRNYSLPYIGNRHKNSSELLETTMRMKRQRALDGTALTIGTGSGSNSSSNLSMNEVSDNASSARQMYANLYAQSGFYGGDCSRTKPINEGNVRADETGFYYQSLNGFGREKTGYRGGKGTGGGVDSEPEVISDSNRAVPFQQQTANGKKSYGGGGGTSFRMEKLRYRMIKNRESAARSRARKQALEAQQQLENTELKSENDALKKIVRILMTILRPKELKLPRLTRSFSAKF